jgi:hypothetical protein
MLSAVQGAREAKPDPKLIDLVRQARQAPEPPDGLSKTVAIAELLAIVETSDLIEDDYPDDLLRTMSEAR